MKKPKRPEGLLEETLAFRLTRAERKKIDQIAMEQDRSPGYIARKVVSDWLKKQEVKV